MILEFMNIGILNFCFLCLRVLTSDSFPKSLTKKEEMLLFEKKNNGDEKAREKLIEHNLRLVAHIIKKYYTSSNEEEDLISIGTIGLIKAIDSFKTTNGAKFATYAGKCIQNEILMYFRLQKKTQIETSMNETVEVDKNGNALTILDIISVDDNVLELIDLKNKTRVAFRGIETVLTPRERKILVLRFGLDNNKPMTQRECAEKLSISRSYVSRIEKQALDKLHQFMKENGEA